MKKLLLFSSLLILLFSCQSSSPKKTAQEFIKALYSADLAKAATLASSDSKAVVDKAKKETKHTTAPEESFQFSTLTETISDKKAEVKNELVSIPLVKEEEGWKVALDEKLLNEIQNREALLSAVKTKWDALLKEYEARLAVQKIISAIRKVPDHSLRRQRH